MSLLSVLTLISSLHFFIDFEILDLIDEGGWEILQSIFCRGSARMGTVEKGRCESIQKKGQSYKSSAPLIVFLPLLLLYGLNRWSFISYVHYGMQLFTSADISTDNSLFNVFPSIRVWFVGNTQIRKAGFGEKTVSITNEWLKYMVSPDRGKYGFENHPEKCWPWS